MKTLLLFLASAVTCLAQPFVHEAFFAPQVVVGSSCPAPSLTDAIAWWPMDDTSGYDASGNGNTVTLNGLNSQPAPSVTGGQITNALLFSDNQSLTFTQLGNSPFNYSATLWVYPTTVGPNGSTYGTEMLIVDSTRGSYLGLAVSGGAPYKLSYQGNLSSSGLSLNTWHFVAVTYSYAGGLYTVTFYIDSNTPDANTYNGQTTMQPNLIGSFNSSAIDAFSGRLDDVWVYSKVLTTTEIGSIYTKGTTTHCPGR